MGQVDAREFRADVYLSGIIQDDSRCAFDRSIGHSGFAPDAASCLLWSHQPYRLRDRGPAGMHRRATRTDICLTSPLPVGFEANSTDGDYPAD
jgi:hypothetical protein